MPKVGPKISEDVSRAIGNLVWLGCERVTQIVVAIVISGMLARYFGPDVFGKWQYANTLLLVLVPVTWVCGNEILVPTIVHEPPEHLGTILGSAFALRFGISLAMMLLTWVVLGAGAHTHHIDTTVAAMLAGLAMTMLFREPFGVIGSWLQSRTHSKPALLAAIAAAVAKMALVALLVRMAIDAAYFGWLWALEAAAVAAALLAYYARRHGGRLGWHVDAARFRAFVSSGSIFWIGLIGMYLFLKLDRLMLERVVSYADLGRYSAAQQLNENWITLALMLSQTLGPAFVYRVHDKAKLLRNMVRLLVMTAALMTGGAIVLDAIGSVVIRLVFGPGFEGAIDIFRWAVWLSLPAGIEAIANLVVLKYQARYVLLVKWLLALAAAFVVNLVAIPRFGGHGALMGLAAGYLVAIAVDLYYMRLRLTRS